VLRGERNSIGDVVDSLDLGQLALCEALGQMFEWLLLNTHKLSFFPLLVQLPGARSVHLAFNLTSVAHLTPGQSSTHIPFISRTEHSYIRIWSNSPVLW
jgi:hypothetical protein